MDTTITLYDYQALAEFRYHIRRFLHFSEQVVRAAGIEPQHHQLLLAIKGAPAAQQTAISELAERLQLQHHSVVELIDRSMKKGLVQRRRDELDHRRVLVELTNYGEEVLRQLSMHHLDELRTSGPTLVAALNTIIEHGREHPEE